MAAIASERRTRLRARLDVFANRFLDGYPYLCRATEISLDGLRLMRLHEPELPPPRFVGLQFQLPGSSDVLTASGEVVFDDPRSRAVGLRFTHLAPTTKRSIEAFVKRFARPA